MDTATTITLTGLNIEYLTGGLSAGAKQVIWDLHGSLH